MENNLESELLKVSVYGTLAQFWLNLGTKEDMYEDEAKALLLLQQSLIEQFEKTLRGRTDNDSLKEFQDYVDKFKVRIVFGKDQKPTPYLRRQRD